MPTVNWITGEITVLKTDSTLIQASPEIRELDTDAFRLALKDLEDNADGMPWPDTHRHNTEVTIGGITYARFVEIINPYFLTFENGSYAVNLVGSNNNFIEKATLNSVSLRGNNSAGLINNQSATDIAIAVWAKIINGATAEQLIEYLADIIVADADEVQNGTTRELTFVNDPRTGVPTRVDVTPVGQDTQRRRIS